ncbi:MAG: hypothetical protein PHR35_06880 [Kiritimatiellae bacterium]|nr:hypothetical protein [Kiritimatiellia bacterium]
MFMVVAAGVGLTLPLHTYSEQQLLPLDPANSSMTTVISVTLPALGTKTDDDTKFVSGFLIADSRTNEPSPETSLRHSDVHALNAFQFTHKWVVWPFVSIRLDTVISDIQIYAAYPGPQSPYCAVAEDGSFQPTNMSVRMKGTATYSGDASGSFELDPDQVQPLTDVVGKVLNVNGTNVVELTLTFAFDTIEGTTLLGDVSIDISGSGHLRTSGLTAPPSPPRLAMGLSDGTNLATLSWPSAIWPTPVPTSTSAGYWLWRTTNLTDAAAWECEPAQLRDDGTNCIVEAPMNAANRYYRLEWR